jgi:hypothetical protein
MAFPDVCKTPAPPAPPIPIPYPNLGMMNQTSGTSKKVKVMGKEAVTTKSKIPRSMGDEAGTAGGLISGKNMDQILFKKGSSKVKVEGKEWVHHTSMTSHNGSNANAPAGVQVAPSQPKVNLAP